jgi:DNA-binding transcriptional LysR family regulator
MALLASPLESFLTVAATSSISRAAKRLHLSQPAVTKQVRALEHTVGVKLLVRSARGVRLTAAGELLRDAARRSAALLDECQVSLADLAAGDLGKLSIGAGVTTSIFQLPGWLRSYRRRWPRVDIRVRTGSSRDVAELVREREVDCGFVTSEIKQRALIARRLYSEEIVLVAAPSLKLPARAVLESVPLIMFPEHSGFRRFLERAFAAAGLHAQVKMEIDSVEATKALLAIGLGAAFLPAVAVQREFQQKQLRRLAVQGLPRLRRHTSLLLREGRSPSAALANLLRIVSAQSSED